jgi:hypothetical protein
MRGYVCASSHTPQNTHHAATTNAVIDPKMLGRFPVRPASFALLTPPSTDVAATKKRVMVIAECIKPPQSGNYSILRRALIGVNLDGNVDSTLRRSHIVLVPTVPSDDGFDEFGRLTTLAGVVAA